MLHLHVNLGTALLPWKSTISVILFCMLAFRLTSFLFKTFFWLEEGSDIFTWSCWHFVIVSTNQTVIVSTNQIWFVDIAGRIQEFKSSTPGIYTNILHPFVLHCKHIPNADVPLCNKIFAYHPDNRGVHSGIFGRWQTTGVAQLTARLLAVKVFGSRLKCIMQMS